MFTPTSAIGSTTVSTSLSHIPLRREADDPINAASWGMVLSVLLFGLIILVLLQYLKRKQQIPGKQGVAKLRVIQTQRLTAVASLHVVEWAGQELLVAATQSEVRVLSQHAADAKATGENSA